MDSTQVGSIYRADAPAKINLFLEVLGKRADGFHEIETVMGAIALQDTLFFTATRQGRLEVACRWAPGLEAGYTQRRELTRPAVADGLGSLPAAGANLVTRALECFRSAAGVTSGASIQIVKRIPSSAGLGGASSDAAAALVLANEVWHVGWDRQRLMNLAARIGSDVPFFLGGRGEVALCRGRGERIQLLPTAARLQLVVVRPPVGLPTAEVYAGCQAAARPLPVEPILEALRGGRVADLGRRLFNRLEAAAAERTPWIGRLRAVFQRLDLAGFQMSGSGSSFFGICRHRQHARRIASVLRAANIGQVFATMSVPPRCRVSAVLT